MTLRLTLPGSRTTGDPAHRSGNPWAVRTRKQHLSHVGTRIASSDRNLRNLAHGLEVRTRLTLRWHLPGADQAATWPCQVKPYDHAVVCTKGVIGNDTNCPKPGAGHRHARGKRATVPALRELSLPFSERPDPGWWSRRRTVFAKFQNSPYVRRMPTGTAAFRRSDVPTVAVTPVDCAFHGTRPDDVAGGQYRCGARHDDVWPARAARQDPLFPGSHGRRGTRESAFRRRAADASWTCSLCRSRVSGPPGCPGPHPGTGAQRPGHPIVAMFATPARRDPRCR
jgi:hypothetical protein